MKYRIQAKAFILFLMIITAAATSNAQEKSSAEPVITLKQFIEYKKLLDDETRTYREFIQNFSILGGAAALIFGAILTWMNWKTRSDVQLEVQKQLEAVVRQEVARMFPELEKNISATVEDVTKRLGLLEEDAKRQKSNLDEIVRDAMVRRAEISRMIVEISGSIRVFSNIRPDLAEEITSQYQEKFRLLNILWVDDAPSNNTYQVSTLKALGTKITQKLSTEAALQELETNPNHAYNLIISDMGRGADYTAGLTLLKEVRRKNFDIPYVIFCSSQAEQKYKADAMNLGAFAITSSTTTLFGDVTEVAKNLIA